jgi:hypothetical protein
MLLKSLYVYFMQRPSVTSKIVNRLRPAGLDQTDPMPSADMRVVSGSHDHTIEGLSGQATSSVTFDCYADDPEDADTLAESMMYSGVVGYRGLIEDQSGTLAGAFGDTFDGAFDGAFGLGPFIGVFINSVRIESGPRQSVEGVNPGSNLRRYVTSFTLQIIYSRPCR